MLMGRSCSITSEMPRGRPKSGRVWREPGTRSRSRVVASGLQKSWKSRQVECCEAKAIKELEKELRETAQKEKEEKKRKLAEKHQKKLENQKKGEVVQKITNAAKLKRLKKRQLRTIEKR